MIKTFLVNISGWTRRLSGGYRIMAHLGAQTQRQNDKLPKAAGLNKDVLQRGPPTEHLVGHVSCGFGAI